MKTLLNYIFESLKNNNKNNDTNIIEASKIIYDWFVNNFGNFYDHEHGKNKEKLIPCSLLNNSLVKGDCSGYIGAVLCYCKLIDNSDTCHLNVRHGSFNPKKIVYLSNYKPNKNILKNIIYMTDIKGNWIYNEYTSDNDLKEGDILCGKGHVAIVAKNDNNKIKIYDWGSRVEDNINHSPVNIYFSIIKI